MTTVAIYHKDCFANTRNDAILNMRILAIETSCDETAASVIETDGADVKILSNVIASQIDIHKQFGGVFPEKASRAHAEKIIPVVEQALKEAEEISFCEVPVGAKRNRTVREAENKMIFRSRSDNIDLIAVTTGPGLIGSLLIGINFAKTFAYVKNKPIVDINHWLGHIYSNWAVKPYPLFPALFLIVSGGHTGLVLMKSHTEIVSLGQTLDDAAGEAFDKVAKILGLDYPGGPAISIAAEASTKNSQTLVDAEFLTKYKVSSIKLPRPMIDSKNYDFSFSGLKTAVLNEVRKLQAQGIALDQYQSQVAREFQQATIDVLISKTMAAAYEYKPKSICLCGGVSANKELRAQMQKATEKLPWSASYHVPEIILSTDNAAMIGIAAAYHLEQKTTWDKINVNSNLKLS